MSLDKPLLPAGYSFYKNTSPQAFVDDDGTAYHLVRVKVPENQVTGLFEMRLGSLKGEIISSGDLKGT